MEDKRKLVASTPDILNELTRKIKIREGSEEMEVPSTDELLGEAEAVAESYVDKVLNAETAFNPSDNDPADQSTTIIINQDNNDDELMRNEPNQ